MSTLKQILIGIVVVLVSLAAGYGFGKKAQSDTSVKSGIKTDIVQDKNTHTQTKTVTVKQPDGKVETTTTTDTVTLTKETENKDVQSSTTVTASKSKINVSAMVQYDIFHPSFSGPAYGLSVSKEVLGPITVGAYGLTNGTIGITVGVDF